jgi:hypothetical protein
MSDPFIGEKILCPECHCEYVHIESISVAVDEVLVHLWCEDADHRWSKKIYYRKGHTLIL